MAVDVFTLSIELSGDPGDVDVLRALSEALLAQVGCAGDAARLVTAIRGAASPGGERSAHGCIVRFLRSPGRLDVTVATDGGEVWRDSCATM